MAIRLYYSGFYFDVSLFTGRKNSGHFNSYLMKNLGWMNSWKYVVVKNTAVFDVPEYNECKRLGHEKREVVSKHTKFEHTVFCDKCGIFYSYDSS